MRLRGTSLAALLLVASSAFAAPKLPAVRFNHPLSTRHASVRTTAAPDTVTIVAARIAFPFESPDNSFTTGQGVFDTSVASSPYLDAPPHNGKYFQHHLDFVANYVAAASAGKTIVRTIMLPNAATAPQTMGSYAPPTTSTTNEELARLVEDAWHAIDSVNPTFDFASLDSSRTFYILFHAGVGRDVDLSSTLGYNPQPQDLPSLYFNLDALRAALGAAYSGVPMHDGAHVTNSAVIPETESRVVSGSQLVLGLNGLIASSFGSYCGLPDLFNTTFGYTAIGRFGLEDVAAIFSFAGVFPPLPNAWERMQLGWINPVDLSATSTLQHTLAAPQVATATDTTVLRALISDREYFLLENRERNPDGKGIVVQVATGDTIKQFPFPTDENGFNSNDLSAITGVVTGCSDYDWGLAGSGILIWHIDQNIIDQYSPTNAINGDGHVRGVRLMEADGAQQIGVPVVTVFGTTFISEGDDGVDGNGNTWHRGNTVNFPRYSNEFSDTTQPDAHSNASTPSGLRFFAFDTIQSRMKFDFAVQGAVHIASGFPQSLGANGGTNPVVTADINGDRKEEIFVATPTALLAWNPDGSKLISNTDATAVFASEPGIFSCATIDTLTKKVFAVSQNNNIVALTAWFTADANHDGRADTVFRRVLNVAAPRSFNVPMLIGSNIITVIDTMIFVFDEKGNQISSRSIRGGRNSLIDQVVSISAVDDNAGDIDTTLLVMNESGHRATMINIQTGVVQWSTDVGVGSSSIISVGDVYSENAGSEIIVNCECGKTVLLDHAGNIVTSRKLEDPATSASETPASPNVAVLFAGSMAQSGATHLFAEFGTGVSMSDFPVLLASGLTSAPIIASQEISDGSSGTATSPNIFAATTDGLLHLVNTSYPGYSAAGTAGFPLSLGSAANAAPAVASGRLYVATSAGKLLAYDGNIFAPTIWPQYLHDAAHTNLALHSVVAAPLTDFFPKDRVYNWPNPVHDKFTHVRFFVSTNAVVHIRITNLANELVMSLPDFNATGGIDNEVELHTGNIQTGIYIVRVEADAPGKSDVAFIKMAVVN